MASAQIRRWLFNFQLQIAVDDSGTVSPILKTCPDPAEDSGQAFQETEWLDQHSACFHFIVDSLILVIAHSCSSPSPAACARAKVLRLMGYQFIARMSSGAE